MGLPILPGCERFRHRRRSGIHRPRAEDRGGFPTDGASVMFGVMRVERPGSRLPRGLVFLDGEGGEVFLDDDDATALLRATANFDAATVSACPDCRSRVLAAVALVDVLDEGPPYPGAEKLVDLADDAPTLHIYVVDGSSSCRHRRWLDPGYGEWLDALEDQDG